MKVSLIGIVILTNVFLATVLGLIHQGAPISVMQHLRDVDIVSPKDSILFLTPCHSTPYYRFFIMILTLDRFVSIKYR
jgi:hypothetical protein